MKFVQKLLMSIGGLAAAAALLTLVSPKARAIVATLVEVTNTRSAPVPNQDVDAPERHPFALVCNPPMGVANVCSFAPVPANTELVIQTVSISSVVTNSNTLWPLSSGALQTEVGGIPAKFAFPVVGASENSGSATQSLTVYADPGTVPACVVYLPISFPSTFMTCTITGYTVSLP
jgi:hypothetical protein